MSAREDQRKTDQPPSHDPSSAWPVATCLCQAVRALRMLSKRKQQRSQHRIVTPLNVEDGRLEPPGAPDLHAFPSADRLSLPGCLLPQP